MHLHFGWQRGNCYTSVIIVHFVGELLSALCREQIRESGWFRFLKFGLKCSKRHFRATAKTNFVPDFKRSCFSKLLNPVRAVVLSSYFNHPGNEKPFFSPELKNFLLFRSAWGFYHVGFHSSPGLSPGSLIYNIKNKIVWLLMIYYLKCNLVNDHDNNYYVCHRKPASELCYLKLRLLAE